MDYVEPHDSHHTAPTVDNTRKKIIWSDDCIENYQNIISDSLLSLRQRWMNPISRSSVSLLLKLTSEILSSAATTTNKTIDLSQKVRIKSDKVPKEIVKSNKILLKLSKKGATRKELSDLKVKNRKLLRNYKNYINIKRDEEVFSILSSNPNRIYKRIKSLKSSATEEIPFLTVGEERYYGKNVKDGFFASIKNLKTSADMINVTEHWAGIDIKEDYRNILDICRSKVDLPKISIEESTSILMKMKPTVNDFYSVTTLHYINAGKAGLVHFNFLLNCIISEVNNAKVEELNTVYALLLHKGHGKVKTSDKSYRTISTCPIVSKALDLYIRRLNIEKWNECQAPTQYQGEGSSHELAALLVTEIIQHSKFTLKQPLYLLFLDARSAFDVVVPELMVRNLYLAGMEGNSLIYMNHRLSSRQTYIEWDKTLMGPIVDEHGLEQGGANSSDLYKLYSNNLLVSTQKSLQGVNLGNNNVISSVGLADDTVLSANQLTCLWNILYLTIIYCKKFGVSLCPTKTRLLRISNDAAKVDAYNPIEIEGKQIGFSNIAEHVGVLRSNDGNLPHILNRISCHKKSLGATLAVGIARGHRANPLVGLRIEKVYATPVLLSGLGSLVLSEKEITRLDQHYKVTSQNIQKLLSKTPRSVVFFLAGSLPLRALLHLRQLALFGMITRLGGDRLNSHAIHVLKTAKYSYKSWFWQIRDICLLYGLPHPLLLLDNPPTKHTFKQLIKSKVIDHWEIKLRDEAGTLKSLSNFHPQYMSLTKPHPLWSTVGSNPHEVTKAIQQARFLSGRYRTETLMSH